jgi:uncharacterized phage-associated protein
VTPFGYNPRKSAQVAAYFALRSGGQVNILKLIKLIYLAEREYISRYDFPMLFDRLVSMRNGPVMSETLNFVNGESEAVEWSEFVSDRENHGVGIVNGDLQVGDLDEFSDADVEVLNLIWDQFGHMSRWELVDYTHKNCPEWEDPGDSSSLIPYERLLRYLGRDNAEHIASEISAMRLMAKHLANAV